uniref:Uncharacterized protein n=1 Tax=Setaria italica TaxID=4555 RepID=K4ANM9_SETIT
MNHDAHPLPSTRRVAASVGLNQSVVLYSIHTMDTSDFHLTACRASS